MAETGRYLYAVTRDLPPEATAGVVGVGGAPVELLEHGDLTVLLSTVDLAEFGEESLRANLEQLPWLERTARAHDDVVRLAAGRGPTAPFRMLTICRDDAAVRTRLDEMHDGLEDALARVAGRHEWSVKLLLPPAEASAPAPAPSPASVGGGAAYLRAKKDAAESRGRREESAARTAQEVNEALELLAVASRRLQPQDPRLTGVPGQMVLNAAYLVDDADSSFFVTEAERLGGRHPELQASVDGPWPPYSFATLEAP